MLKIILTGCNGQMGTVLTTMIAAEADMETVAGIDVTENPAAPYPVYPSLAECGEDADIVVDFSTAKAVDDLLDACVAKKLPLILCTTGLSDAQLAKVQEAAKKIAILRSANMSLGVNLMMKLVQDAARVLAAADFDIEIVEKHHRRKLDAPSGTAISLGESINAAMDGRYAFTFDRSGRHEKRPADEIGFSAVRGGSIVGEHDVIFAGEVMRNMRNGVSPSTSGRHHEKVLTLSAVFLNSRVK